MPDLHRLINQMRRVETRLAIACHRGDADVVKTAIDTIRELETRLVHAEIDLSIAEAQRRGTEDRLGHALARIHRLETQAIESSANLAYGHALLRESNYGQYRFKTGEHHG